MKTINIYQKCAEAKEMDKIIKRVSMGKIMEKEVCKALSDAIKDESKAQEEYATLLDITIPREDKKIIKSIMNEESKHEKKLEKIYGKHCGGD